MAMSLFCLFTHCWFWKADIYYQLLPEQYRNQQCVQKQNSDIAWSAKLKIKVFNMTKNESFIQELKRPGTTMHLCRLSNLMDLN